MNNCIRMTMIAAFTACILQLSNYGFPQPLLSTSDPQVSGIVTLLEQSGFGYTKVSDGVWEIQASGDNVKDFPIRVAGIDDSMLIMVKIADREKLALRDELPVKLLEFNHKFDIANTQLFAT